MQGESESGLLIPRSAEGPHPPTEGVFREYKGIVTDPLLLYVLILLSVPQGVLDLFSPYHFRSPVDTKYGMDLLNEPVSLLYLPIVLFVIHHALLTNRPPGLSLRGLTIFWAAFLAWQPLVAWVSPHPMVVDIHGEMFFAYFVAFSFLYAIATRIRTPEDLSRFLIIFAALQCIGIAVGLTLGQKSINERINAPNLNFGDTSFLLGLFVILLALRPSRLKGFTTVPLLLQVMSGSRSTLVLTLGILPFAIATSSHKPNMHGRGFSVIRVFLWSGLVLLILLASANLLSSQQTDVASRLNSLTNPSEIDSDASTLGRLASLAAGIQVLIFNPMGLPFSFIELQQMMNRFGYPTFPHNNLLSTLIVFGPFALILIFFFFRSGYRLFVQRSPIRFCFLYVAMYSLIAGGCPHKVKPIFIYLLVLLLFTRVAVGAEDPVVKPSGPPSPGQG